MRGRVCSSSSVAVLALYTGCYWFGRVISVTVEAAADFRGIDEPPGCFIDVAAGAIEVPRREVERFSKCVVTERGLIESAVLFIHVSLAHRSNSEGPLELCAY